jgi:hypothetical protein
MPHLDHEVPAPLHPVRESAGFLLSALAALRGLLWPGRRHTPQGDQPITNEAEPVTLSLTDRPKALVPYPIDD